MKDIKNNQTEHKIKSIISEMKNILDGINSKLDITVEKNVGSSICILLNLTILVLLMSHIYHFFFHLVHIRKALKLYT